MYKYIVLYKLGKVCLVNHFISYREVVGFILDIKPQWSVCVNIKTGEIVLPK